MAWRRHKARVTKVNVIPFLKNPSFLYLSSFAILPATLQQSRVTSKYIAQGSGDPHLTNGLPIVMGIWSSGMILA
jgi:hypothetical protein